MSAITDFIARVKSIGIPVYRNFATTNDECIVLQYNTVAANKITERIRVKLTIIATPERCDLIEAAVKEACLTFADENLDDILQSEVNGGGVLYDEARNKQHTIIYFELITRC